MQVSPIFDTVWKTIRRCLNGPVGFAFAAALIVVITYQLVSKPATAQGITYSLSGKTAKSTTAATLPGATRRGFQPVSSNKSDGKAKDDLAGDNVWTSNGPYGGQISVLAVDPLNPSVIYAGTFGGGVYKSTDGGASWTLMNQGLTYPYVNALALNPANPAVLYATARRRTNCASASGRSTPPIPPSSTRGRVTASTRAMMGEPVGLR